MSICPSSLGPSNKYLDICKIKLFGELTICRKKSNKLVVFYFAWNFIIYTYINGRSTTRVNMVWIIDRSPSSSRWSAIQQDNLSLMFAPTTTRNFKRVEITHICLILDQTFANLDV